MSRAFEDFPVGTRLVSTSCPITAEAIMDFGREFDPQVFHLDPKLAEKTLFGGLAASGWHTAAVSMRLFIDTMNVSGGIVGLGVDELKWPNAVRPGDELRWKLKFSQRGVRNRVPATELFESITSQKISAAKWCNRSWPTQCCPLAAVS
jgi:Acyl dehydratase